MASPFRFFRKYQKTLLVVAGVILMLVFVVGDSLSTFIRGAVGGAGREGAMAPNAVAVRWDGGKLTNNELGNMVVRRRLVNAFVRAVEFQGRKPAIEAGVEPRTLRVEPIIGAETPEQRVENDVVHTRLFADLARQAGMRISDEAIVRYLGELGRGRVSPEDMRQIIQRMQVSGSRASIDYIIDALRDEMLARNYLASYQFSLATVTPEERWNDWLRVNDRIVLEVAAFPVEKFLVDVPEPTDVELTAFVEKTDDFGNKYKDRESQPDFLPGGMELPSRHPGFAIPRKIDVQYIRADYDKFLTKVENEITDEEIAKYYEDNKDPLFIKADTGLIDDASKADESGNTDAAATQTDTPNAAKTEEAAGTTGAGQTDGQTPPASDTTQPPAGAGSGDATPPQGNQSSLERASEPSPFRLAAFLQDAGGTAPADTGTAPADTSASATTAPAAGAAATTPPADAPSDTAPAGETTAAPTTTPAASAPAATKPKEFQPLEEVRDEIRRQLAEQRVSKQLIDLMAKLDGELNGEFTKYFAASLNAGVDEKSPPPPTGALADLAPLAEKNGLESGKTGPLSVLEMRKTPVGESVDSEMQAELWRLLFFSKDLQMYQPVSTFDLDGNRYLSMKTSDTPGRVPTLAEVRDDVVKAWKLQKAAELADKHAQEVAKKIQESGSTLSDYFTDDSSVTVVRTDPFSWLTGGEVSRITGQQQPFRLSEPDGVAAAGPEFMLYVFDLDDGKAGATLNHDHSVAYVVRVADHQLSPEELRMAYLAEANTWPALGSMISGHMQSSTRSLLADVRDGANIQWERPADEIAKEE